MMKLKLPAVARAMLQNRGGVVDEDLRASRARLVKTCAEHGYPSHASVIAFESAFGGFMIPEEGSKLKKTEPYWLFGAHACLASGAHAAPRGGSKARKLVPVVYSPNDIIYYLDEKGRAYAEDTIEESSASPYADSGTALVCRILIDDAVFSRQETSVDLPGLRGNALSTQFNLALIKEASGKDRRFFSDATGSILVVEEINARRTRVATSTKTQLKQVQQPFTTITGKTKLSPATAIFQGKTTVSIVGEQRTSLPDIFDDLPDLRALDVSINRLETLPESLWRVTQLTSLNLSFNPLRALPDGIENMKSLRSLSLRGCPLKTLPDALAGAKNLVNLSITECKDLDIDKALPVIATLPKLKELSLPLSRSLTSLAPLAKLPLKYLLLSGASVEHPDMLPSGMGQLTTLKDLYIEYADDVSQLPDAIEDVQALRLLFSKKFKDDDIRESVRKQPEKLYLKAFVNML